jgi:GT2 family glycosyltransferase/SAM-dependent methyltransferase
MPASTPLVSIIIPHQAGTEILVDCLEALAADGSHPDTEVLLVDNGSSDGSVQEAQRRFPHVRVIRLERNEGYAGGCNRGIRASRGDYVLLLNDDTKVSPGCVGALVQAAEADPTIGACQPKIRSLRDPSQFEYSGAAGGLMDIYAYPFSRGRLMGHVEEDRGQYDDPIEIFWASGVCMLIRRSALDEAGLFDETFFAYMEEIDLCWRIHLQGRRIVYVPTAVVYHIGGYSLDQRVLKRIYLNHRNSTLTLLKNYSTASLWRILPVKILLECCILVAALARNPLRSLAVLQSFGWLLTHVPTIARLRREVQGRRRVPDSAIAPGLYQGMAPIWYFLFGVRKVTDLPDIDRVLHRPNPPAGRPAAGERVQPAARNFLYAYLDQAPIGLALMRAVECAHLSRLPFERPILDLGCGDGTFARILFNGVVVDAGVDANADEVARARANHCYADVRTSRIESLPFEAGTFATAYSNCVLEHVKPLEAALQEVHRVLKPDGRLYLTVPNPRCKTYLLWTAVLSRLGLHALARWYADLTLRLFKAEHVMEADGWAAVLARTGFRVEHHEPYMPLRASRLQDLFMLTGAISVLAKRLRGRLLLFPRLHRARVRLYRTLLVGPYEERAPLGSATMIVARRVAVSA